MRLIKRYAGRCANLVQRALKSKTVGVRALIFNKDNSVLLVRHTYRPGWHTPGGGVNAGESPADAIVREVREETGLIIATPTKPFAVYLNKWNGLDDYPILYVIKEHDGRPTVNDAIEIEAVNWFHLDALPPEITIKTRSRIEEALGLRSVSTHW